MMRVAQPWQSGPVDIGMALGYAEVLSSILKSRTALQLENIALRHQIIVLQRSTKKRLQLHNSDRLFWVGLSQLWSEWRSALVIVKPETVIAWHRKAFRLFWTWKVQHGKPGRPAISLEIRTLIRRIGETSVSKYLVRRRKPGRVEDWRRCSVGSA